MFIGPWQELALARQLQAARAAERNVSLVLQELDDAEGEDSHELIDRIASSSIPSAARLQPRLRAAPPRPRLRQHARPPPALPPPPLQAIPTPPLVLPSTQPWAIKAGRKQPQREQPRRAQQSVPAGGDQPPPRLRDVERMRRAYLSRSEGQKQIEEQQDDQSAADKADGLPLVGGDGDKMEAEDGDVDALMEWVQGLESEDDEKDA